MHRRNSTILPLVIDLTITSAWVAYGRMTKSLLVPSDLASVGSGPSGLINFRIQPMYISHCGQYLGGRSHYTFMKASCDKPAANVKRVVFYH